MRIFAFNSSVVIACSMVSVVFNLWGGQIAG